MLYEVITGLPGGRGVMASNQPVGHDAVLDSERLDGERGPVDDLGNVDGVQ